MMHQKQYLLCSFVLLLLINFTARPLKSYAITAGNPAVKWISSNDDLESIQDMIERLTLRIDSETFTTSSTTLIGFTSAATAGFDPGFDSPRLDTSISIFSILETGEQLAIQGREAFDPAIIIDLGFITEVVEPELYTISISEIDGSSLEAVRIILIDHLLDTLTILNEGDYSFTETETTQLDRFQIIFEVPATPGGVSGGLSYWLKADAGVTQSAGSVSSWNNQVFESTEFVTQGTTNRRPGFTENALNFNPAISFDGVNDFLTTTTGWDSNTQIIVFNPTQTVSSVLSLEIPLAYDLPGNALADAGIGVGNLPGAFPCTNTYFFNSGDNDLTSPEYIACLDDATFSTQDPFLATVRENVAGTFSEHRLWGGDESPTISNPSEYGIHTDRPFSVGRRHNGGFQYQGDVVEAISYSSRISGANLNKIESYLAIKYGITLDQTIAQDYINSEGSSIYNASGVLDAFDHHITGIGRDDGSGLHQKQSLSVHSGALVTIGNETIAIDNVSNNNDFNSDLSFMLWGNNAGATTFETPITILCGTLNRMQRIWAIQETATVGNVTLRIPQSSFSSNIPTLLLSSDTTFDENDTMVVLTNDGNGNYETVVNFSNGDYFTFAELDREITVFDGMGETGWTNGIPTMQAVAIINDDYDTATRGDIDACSCQINANQTLTVRDGNFINIAGNIVVDGTLIIENAGSVVQMEDAAVTTNNGIIQVQKTTPLLKPRDFILLSSPMSAETRSGVYASADRAFLIDATEFEPDDTTTGTGAGVTFLDVDGNYFSPATSLTPGEGYIVFPQAVTDVGDVNFAHTYTQGTLNNGTIDFPLVYNSAETTDNFNLMGNPYPSAINVSILIDENAAINEVYYWEHITTPDENLPGFNTQNFSMDDVSIRNMSGGIASVNGGTAPGQFMASGQGFGILANGTLMGTPLSFNNAMRVTASNGTVRTNEQDINRLWLRLDSETFSLKSINLIGFTPEATTVFDPGYDSKRLATTISLFSTLEEGEQLSIQSRELFDPTMQINLGFQTLIPETENYTISIDQLEGAGLEQSDIFLIDHLLGTTTNLKETSYTFASSETTQENRFTLVFEDQLLSTEETSLENNLSLYPNPARDQINLTYTGNQNLQALTITDVQGKVIKQLDLRNATGAQTIDVSRLSSGLYFFTIIGSQNSVTQKVIID